MCYTFAEMGDVADAADLAFDTSEANEGNEPNTAPFELRVLEVALDVVPPPPPPPPPHVHPPTCEQNVHIPKLFCATCSMESCFFQPSAYDVSMNAYFGQQRSTTRRFAITWSS